MRLIVHNGMDKIKLRSVTYTQEGEECPTCNKIKDYYIGYMFRSVC